MIDPLLAAARRWPEAPALADATGTWTWAQLLDEASGLATTLEVAPAERVALLATDGAASAVAIHAVRLAGGVLVPLHRRLAAPELATQLTRSRVSVLLHDDAAAAVASTLRSQAGLDRLVDVRDRAATGRCHATRDLDPDTPGAIVHTSGTTSSPRGVVLSHAALLASAVAWNAFLDSGPRDHWLSTLPLSHVAGLGMVLRPLLSGARLTIHDRFEPDAVLGALGGDDVTLLSLVATQLARVLDAGPVHAAMLRALLLGGGPVPAGLVRRALDAGWPVVTTYGLTEAASGVTALSVAAASVAPGSAGRPLPGNRVRVVDAAGGDVSPGETGSIVVAGPTLADGYDGDPVATRATFVDGWLHTRDAGRLDADGRLWVLDRLDELIVSGGENVSPVEVESVLAMHPSVADVAVVGRPDAIWGAVPVAAVVPRPGRPSPTFRVLRAFAEGRLARYKLPRELHLVPAIPRTGSGKVVRREVAALVDAASPVVDAGSPAVDAHPDHESHDVNRPDGARIHVEVSGTGPVVMLLHATLSDARELRPLADELSGVFRVLSVDRRAAGASRMPPDDPGGPVDVGTHVDDLVGVLDTLSPGARPLVVGHSFGGCVALELAARHPGRVAGAWVFEPPYLPLLPDTETSTLTSLGERVAAVARDQGPTAAAFAFLDGVRGPGFAERLPATVRERLGAEGRAAVADAALLGLDPEGLARIEAPVGVGLGDRDAAPYAAVARALADRIPVAAVERFPGLGHGGPVGRPAEVASAIMAFAQRIGHVRPGQTERPR